VTPQLLAFEPLLRALGVRESLSPRDYVHANTCFVRDAKERPLAPETLKACVASLGAIVTSAQAEGSAVQGSADVLTQHGAVFVPDTACVLRPVAELTFDDAPWMSTALRAQPDGAGLRFVRMANAPHKPTHASAHHGAPPPPPPLGSCTRVCRAPWPKRLAPARSATCCCSKRSSPIVFHARRRSK